MPQAPIVVAEIGSNHGGDPKIAQAMVRQAAAGGITWIKFQAYQTESFLHPQSPYFNELKREELDFDEFRRLIDLAHRLNLKVGLTVFCKAGVALAATAGADFVKISSGDLTYLSLIASASRCGLPLVLSTGASTEAEVTCALAATNRNLLALLQCVSLYPAPAELLDLAVMVRWLAMGRPAGFSDHSLGPEAACAALALGAVMVEKHFTTDRSLPGGDNSMSATLEEFKAINSADRLDPAPFLGSEEKTIKPGEEPSLIRRVAVAARNIKAGETMDEENVIFLRPPQLFEPALGAAAPLSDFKARLDIPRRKPILLSYLNGPKP
jgi:N-acetylneuraminate synthase/N,N'-diacetyllegionaminate synthase